MAADKRRAKKKAKGRPVVESEEPVKDPGPPYVVVWHPEADAERERSWPPKEKAAMLNAVQKLEAAGPRLGSPHSSAVYRQVKASTFVILAVAPEAQIDSRGFDAAVARAVERYRHLELD
jgi:hypothetical protein